MFNKWNNKVKWSLALSLVLTMVFTIVALADNLKNDVVAGGNDTITAGESTTIKYWIQPTGGTCDAADGSSATVTINAPPNVSVTPTSLTFNACNTSNEANPTNTKSVVFSSSTVGSYAITATVTDSSGSYNTAPANFTLYVNAPADSTPPTINCSVPDQLVWYGSDVDVNCTASDSGSGLKYSADASFTLSTTVSAGTETDSATTGSKEVCDNENNCATAGPYTFKVDKKAPVVTCGPADSIWHATDQSVTCTATDGGSGPASQTLSLSTSVAAGTETDSAYTNSQSVSDNVGNSATAGPVGPYKIDKKDPTYSCDAAPSGWSATDVNIACTASDGGSGLATLASFNLSTNVAVGTETDNASTGTATVTDNVGHSVTAGPISGIKIDKKAPQQVSCESPDGLWHAGDVTLKCAYTDGGSGPATQEVSLSTSVVAGTETDNAVASAGGAQACDAVNNCAASPADIGGNKVDKKAPTGITFVGSISDDGVYYWGFVPPAPTCTATDGGSGLADCLVTGYSAAIGAHTLTATATDNVGNSAKATRSYEVKAWTLSGFYHPVDKIPAVNTVKGGSTVPLKFEVFAGSMELTDIAIVSSLIKQVTCLAGPEDTIEVLATGGTSLRYDWTAGQFIFNWQTPRLPGKCYTVTMTTLDGSMIEAYFKLK